MYAERFKLKTLPFENVPDPKFFFDRGDFGRVRSRIDASLAVGRGLLVVTGPIGSGKTTISQMIISGLPHDVKLIWLAEPPGSSRDLFFFIAQEIGLRPPESDRVFLVRDIRGALMDIVSRGGRCLVIIDESHLMSDEVMNGIRLLNNLEDGPNKLVQVLLLGQDELLEKIGRPEMEPFRQRIADLEVLGKMRGERIREYVLHRVGVAGGDPALFSDEALHAVVKAFNGEGIPRKINLLCNGALEAAFDSGRDQVGVRHVWMAAEAMGIGKDVFFYMKEVEQKGTTREITSPETAVPREPAVTNSGRTHDPGTPSVPEETEAVSAEAQKKVFFQEGDRTVQRGGLMMPFIMLLIAVASLVGSFVFYWQRSGLDDPAACIQELLRF